MFRYVDLLSKEKQILKQFTHAQMKQLWKRIEISCHERIEWKKELERIVN